MHSSLDFAGYIDMSPLIPTWVLETIIQQEMASSFTTNTSSRRLERGIQEHRSRRSYRGSLR